VLRLFVGLELPDGIRARLLALRAGIDGARWQEDEQLHLTLRFIGEVSETVAEDADSALSGISFTPFDAELRGIGIFGTLGKPRMLWTGGEPADRLGRLHTKIDTSLVRAGLAPETRKYKPHVTLARFRGSTNPDRLGKFLHLHDDLRLPPWPVENFSLFRSHLSHNGAAYEVLARYPG
jgi:2'-5' RNA ligase